MTIPPGKRLGPYEVISALGAGGMGEVYRAKDTRLDRTVAIKVLPEQAAVREGVRERFEREARAISSLNHPHICVLYDVGHQDGTDYLVMELCEGETLAARLGKGPLPIDRVLQYSIEICEALEKAHRMGVTHRDLKPGNIMVTKSGIKLLDFGLAKLRQEASPTAPHSDGETTADPLTSAGMILGTVQYMAPEQLEGKEVDGRADIFAFGAVMYEMAAGKRAFEGDSQATVIAAILEREPPLLSSLQPKTPPALERVVKACLAKDPDERWQTAGDLRRELKWISDGSSQIAAPALATQVVHKRRNWLQWGVAAVLGLIAVALGVVHFTEKPPAAPMPVRLQVRLPDKVEFTRSATLEVSPDGQHVAFSAIGPDGHPHIWIQDLAGSARVLSETDTSSDSPPPFWSPDSRFVVFSGNFKVRKADILSGAVQDICEKPGPVLGGSWSREDVIIFGGPVSGLWKAPAGGGSAAPLTSLDVSRHEREHELPSFLPDGRHFLYLRVSNVATESGIYVGSLDDAPGRQSMKRILATNFGATFVPSSSGGNAGRLLFFRDGNLMAQSFDSDKFELRGEPSLVAERIGTAYETAQFSAASNVLVFRGPRAASQYQLTWYDDTGKPMGKVGEPGAEFANRQISPDGSRVVFARGSENRGNRDLWILDLNRGTTMRLTFGPYASDFPVWSPDGREIVFSSNRDGVFNLYRKAVDGSRPEELLLRTDEDKRSSSWSRDGRLVFYEAGKGLVTNRLWALPMTGESKPVPISNKLDFDEGYLQISPDEHWITYISNETGPYEAYLQEFKADSITTGSKFVISRGGALFPTWRADGKAIAYVGNARTSVVSVPIDGGRFQAGAAQVLFALPADRGGTNILAASGDHKRFLFPVAEDSETPQSFTVMVNWMPVAKAK